MTMVRFAIESRFKTAICAIALLAPLAGCGTTDRIVASPVALEDYTVRHPIVIAEEKTTLDIFPAAADGRLDRHSAKQVYGFANEYRELGQGPILVLVPRGRGLDERGSVVADIRRVLSARGARSVEVASYPIADPALASPVRLVYRGVKAKVADQCGQWPSDVGSGSSIEGWDNKPYWNFGCATQTMIAAQTSDPRDLVAPRGEEAPDTLTRSRAIESVRKGSDPNTSWTVKNSNISSVGGS
jgi:pilus assembly protein CpaD